MTFSNALNQYIVAMKMMLATADQESITTLENALQIYEKMGNRLKLIVKLRYDESKDGTSLQELLRTVQQTEIKKHSRDESANFFLDVQFSLWYNKL